jgi:HK97 family phage portal protein
MASFFDRFKNLIVKNTQQTAKEYNQAIYNFLGQSVVWNPENDENYINEGYRKNATVYSIINLIAKSASSVPLCIYEKVNDNELAKYKAMTSGIVDPTIMHKANMLRKHALVELEHTSLHELLERPNPSQSYASWIGELVAFGKLTGNRYIYGIAPDSGDNAGKYKELYVMPSQIMEVVSGGILEPVKSYRIEYSSGQRDIPAEQICHIKDFQPYYDGSGSHLYGQSPLKAGFRAMTTNNEAAQTGVKYLQNQMARGVLMSDEGDLNEVQAQQLKDKFKNSYQSSNNAGDVIITPKKLSWVNFGLSASDLSLIEQYNASVKDLCNIFNVPVQLLNNTESSTYNNQKSAKAALYQHAVMPELYKIRDELNRWLAPKFGDNIYLDFDFSVIPELQDDMEKVVEQMTKAWWITPNEKRAAMSYAEEENEAMNDIYVPANLLPISGEDVEMPDPQPSKIDEEDEDVEKMLLNYIVNKETIKPKKVDKYSDYPQSASNNAKRMIEWREKHGKDIIKGTAIGWERASNLSKREKLTKETVEKMAAFNKNKKNATVDPKFEDTPWKDNGYVTWNLLGGTSGINWAIKKMEQIRNND